MHDRTMELFHWMCASFPAVLDIILATSSSNHQVMCAFTASSAQSTQRAPTQNLISARRRTRASRRVFQL